MLPEIGASEILVIAVVALIVVGPKDLPALLRRLGQFTAKLRGMASEFRASFDEMARQSELDDLRKEVEAMRKGQLLDIADRSGAAEMNAEFEALNRSMTDAGVQLHPPMSFQYDSPAIETAEAAALEAPKPARTRKAPAKSASAKAAPAKAAARKPAAAKPAATGSATARKARTTKAGEGAA